MPEREEERSEEVEEVLERTPSWPLRWGASLFLLLLLGLFIAFWTVRYPETVEGKALLHREQHPVLCPAPANGIVDSLFVADGEPVRAGDELLFVGDRSAYRTARSMKECALRAKKLLEKGKSAELPSILHPVHTPVDEAWRRFELSAAEYERVMGERREEEERFFRSSLAQVRKSLRVIAEEKRIAEARAELQKQRFEKMKELHSGRAVAEREFTRSKEEFLQSEAALKGLQRERVEQEERLLRMKRERIREREELERQRKRVSQELRASFRDLLRKLEAWVEEHTLKAPKSGKLSYVRSLEAGDRVEEGMAVLAVVPQGGSFLARVELSGEKAGGVGKGDRVRIRLADHPPEKYGTLKGRVKKRGRFPIEEKYLVQVELTEGLRSSQGLRIPPVEQLEGTAEVLVRDRRLLYRILVP